MAIDNDEFAAATTLANARLAKTPTALSTRYDRRIDRVVIALSSGLEILQATQCAGPGTGPAGAPGAPGIDADLYLPGLLEGFLGSRRWTAAAMGKARGKVASDAKAAAARENGKRGGRPRKNRAVEQVGT